MRALQFFLLSAALGFGASCAHQKGSKLDPWIPGSADANRSKVTLVELEKGLAEYRSHCGGCHMLYEPASQPASKWPHWVKEMSERSHLNPDESKVITAYLVALAKRPPISESSPPQP